MRLIREYLRYKLKISMFFSDIIILCFVGLLALIFLNNNLNLLMIGIYLIVCIFVIFVNYLINRKAYFDSNI